MTNRYRTEVEDEQRELIVEERLRPDPAEHPLRALLDGEKLSTEKAVRLLPFVFFLAFLCMLYIANRHTAEDTLRHISKLNREVKELSWEYKSTKAELAFKSTRSEVAHRVDSMGVKESVQPPQQLVVNDEH
ncbi:MAG: hypothetical protein INR69_11265 [Mucilaginibacter polytrichastri]|nr:hypothetical protein [Mucilaginibacter polytrichastri]